MFYMTRYPSIFFKIYRLLLRAFLPYYLDLRVKIKKPLPAGPKIYAGNHPTVWDVFPPVVAFKHDIIHTLIEEQIWSLPLMNFFLTITNHVEVYRGVKSVKSIKNALRWLARGQALVIAPEGERTAVSDKRSATRGIVRLAVKARVPIVPAGVWIADKDLYMKKVMYHYKNQRYTVDSYFPRFGARYTLVVGKAIHLDEYFGQRLSLATREELADMVMDTIYELKEEAKKLCEGF